MMRRKRCAVASHAVAANRRAIAPSRHRVTRRVRRRTPDCGDSIRFVVCQAIGLECSTVSSDYVELYDGTKETLMESLEHIQQAAREIIQAVVSEPEERSEQGSQQAALAAA